MFVPDLETVGKAHTVPMSPKEAASMQATMRVGKVFNEFDSDSAVMIVLEGDKPLGDDAHHYYDQLVKKVEADTKHVEHVQDFWGDPLTAAGSQSYDGKAAYVQIYLVGDQGESKANDSVQRGPQAGGGLAPAARDQGLCDRRGGPDGRSVGSR